MNTKVIVGFTFVVLLSAVVSLFFYCKALRADISSYKSQVITLNNHIAEKEKQIEILKSSERVNISALESLQKDLDILSSIKDIQIEEIPNLDQDWNKLELPSSISSFLNNADKQYRENK